LKDYFKHLQFIHVSIKVLDDESIKKLIDWLKKNSALHENGFLHYEFQRQELLKRTQG